MDKICTIIVVSADSTIIFRCKVGLRTITLFLQKMMLYQLKNL